MLLPPSLGFLLVQELAPHLDLVLSALHVLRRHTVFETLAGAWPTTDDLVECLVSTDILDIQNIALVCMELLSVDPSVAPLLLLLLALDLNSNCLTDNLHIKYL